MMIVSIVRAEPAVAERAVDLAGAVLKFHDPSGPSCGLCRTAGAATFDRTSGSRESHAPQAGIATQKS